MKKKLLSMLLATTMVFSAFSMSVYAEEEEVAGDEEAGEDSGDIVEINMIGLGFFGEGGKEEVLEQINEIAEEEIGVHVNYTIMDVQTYMSQVPLMMTDTSDPVDLCMLTSIPTTSFSTFTAQNQLLDITEYIDEYAPEMKELMAPYIAATTVDGSIYGVPSYRIYNSNYYIIMRKDILDELGLTEEAKAMKSWSDYKAILEKVRDAQDSLPTEMQTTAMVCNADAQGNVINGMYIDTATDEFAGNYGFEVLNDTNRIIKVNDDGKVENYFADDDYRKTIERVIDWYNDGLVYKDAATAQDTADTEMANGLTFSYIVQSEYGVEQAKANATGYEVVCVPYVSVPIQTSNGNSWGWAVPVTSEEPEAAVAFMNLMYTNPDIENLFVYGVEGRDYELNEEGEACLLDTKEYQNSDFFFGNQFNAYPAQGSGGDFRERALADMETAEISPYYGCVVDTNPVANEITALKAVLTKYENGLESGSSDISNLDLMLEELETAGMQKFLDYYQESLDAWLAEQE